MKREVIITITILVLVLGGILYSMQRGPYATSASETVEFTETSPTIPTPSPPTETSPTPTTQYFQRKEVKVPLKIIRYNFTSDKGFEKILEITSATAYYYLTIEDVEVTGENPKLTIGLKIMVASETRYTGLFHEVNLEVIKLPYTVEDENWVYITGDCKAEYIISVEIHNAKVQGELTIILQEPIELDYNKEYFIKGNYGFLLFKIRNSENNLILLKKSPVGGKIIAIQPVSDCLVTEFSFNRWTPTGVVAELNSVIIPSYYVTWGGYTVNGKMVKGGWMRKVFSTNGLFIVIESKDKEYSVTLSEVKNLGSPQSTPVLKIGSSLDLPTASHVEGVVLNVSIDNAPAMITLELNTRTNEEVPSEFWVGANLVNSSGMVVSTTPAVIIPGESKKVLVYLVAKKNGMYTMWLSYNTGSIAEIGFKAKLLNIEPIDLSIFGYNKEWGVWEGKIEYR
ncbi:MAG: hypothetical protein DRN04_19590 [Thermoprotei archaeon]|nr:MAG: hypothetical protein DRN04_19590 [Thermoprotei archaeon]